MACGAKWRLVAIVKPDGFARVIFQPTLCPEGPQVGASPRRQFKVLAPPPTHGDLFKMRALLWQMSGRGGAAGRGPKGATGPLCCVHGVCVVCERRVFV